MLRGQIILKFLCVLCGGQGQSQVISGIECCLDGSSIGWLHGKENRLGKVANLKNGIGFIEGLQLDFGTFCLVRDSSNSYQWAWGKTECATIQGDLNVN